MRIYIFTVLYILELSVGALLALLGFLMMDLGIVLLALTLTLIVVGITALLCWVVGGFTEEALQSFHELFYEKNRFRRRRPPPSI